MSELASKEVWIKAVKHAKEMLEIYESIGTAGIFGAEMIKKDLKQYAQGYRGLDLLQRLNDIE